MLEQLNTQAREAFMEEMLKCCGSRRWASRMADERPFHDVDALLKTADDAWWGLDAADWLEAFSHHPKIGEKHAAQRVSDEARAWSEHEQSGTYGASDDTMLELLAGNHEYERRFGFIFIVCATGKTSEEMLSLLRARLKNDADTELRIAAGEQSRITRLRLEKLLEQ